jgi:hypothetical protein
VSDLNHTGASPQTPIEVVPPGSPRMRELDESGEIPDGDWALVLGDEDTTGLVLSGSLLQIDRVLRRAREKVMAAEAGRQREAIQRG